MSLGWHKQRAAERRAFARPDVAKVPAKTAAEQVAHLEALLARPCSRSLRMQLGRELEKARARVEAVEAVKAAK